jgi:hypothetical protein
MEKTIGLLTRLANLRRELGIERDNRRLLEAKILELQQALAYQRSRIETERRRGDALEQARGIAWRVTMRGRPVPGEPQEAA